METTSYAIALGSNRRHGRHGAPAGVLLAAIDQMEAIGLRVLARSRIRRTHAMGGAGRAFANAAVIVETPAAPTGLLRQLKEMEARFGRQPGRRWGPRILDLDILLWSGGLFVARGLAVPHPALAFRDFVLQPLAEVAPGWRHPRSRHTVRQLRARLRRAKPVDRSRCYP